MGRIWRKYAQLPTFLEKIIIIRHVSFDEENHFLMASFKPQANVTGGTLIDSARLAWVSCFPFSHSYRLSVPVLLCSLLNTRELVTGPGTRYTPTDAFLTVLATAALAPPTPRPTLPVPVLARTPIRRY